jgi:hypothetical protein
LLLVSHNSHFYERFGNEKMALEGALLRHSFHANGLTTGKTLGEQNALYNIPIFTKGSYVDGVFVPTDPLKYATVYQVVNPKHLSDPSHWGHLVWKFCHFMDNNTTQMGKFASTDDLVELSAGVVETQGLCRPPSKQNTFTLD